MTTPYVYWKTRPDCIGKNQAIGGWCPQDQVPSTGEFGTLPLPTDIVQHVDENGYLTAYSPPIIGSKKAYRYKLSISAQDRATLDTTRLDRHLSVLTCEAPASNTDRANWWWAHHDSFHIDWRTRDAKTPVRLMTRWKAGMLAVLLDGHAHKNAVIGDWNWRVDSHKERNARNRATRTPNHRKAHGDLVILPHPITFTSGNTRQIFRYDVQSQGYRKRDRHSLIAQGTRHGVAHGDARTFADGTVPQVAHPAPIRVAMIILAWNQSRMDTSHGVLAANARFSPLLATAEAELGAWLAGPDVRIDDLRAAVNALRDFRSAPAPTEASRVEIDSRDAVCAHHARLLDRLSLAATQHAPVEDTADA